MSGDIGQRTDSPLAYSPNTALHWFTHWNCRKINHGSGLVLFRGGPMSGYRSLKRVLGESNLERKCRWLFGICVGGLILLAFWWVDRISEGLIEETAQSQGRGLVRNTLIDLHWQWWTRHNESKARQELVQKQNEDLAQDKYVSRILSLDAARDSDIEIAKVFVPATVQERELLEELRREAAERQVNVSPAPPGATMPSKPPP